MDKLSQEDIDRMLNGGSSDDNSSVSSQEEPNPEPAPVTASGIEPPNAMELDILGEVYNISMGAAATAVSSLIRMKVDITTPKLEVTKINDYIYKSLEPAVGVEIKYTVGIHGINTFILSQHDVMKIVDLLLGGTGVVDESTEFNEMHMSAISEVMNQMMGASSTSLAGFLNTMIDISVPTTFKIEGDYQVPEVDKSVDIIMTKFKFIVGDIINSEMITTSSIEFAKEMINKAMVAFGMISEPAIPEAVVIEPPTNTPAPVSTQPTAQPLQESIQSAPIPNPQLQSSQPIQTTPQAQYDPYMQPQQATQQPMMQQQMPMQIPMYTQEQMNAMMQQMQVQMQMQQPTQQMNQPVPQKQNLYAQPASFSNFDYGNESTVSYDGNMELILDLPLEITIEIGRTKRTVQEILDLGEGSIIELDNQAGEPVDIIVNGSLVAKGSVIVIDENFAVKITEIVSNQDKLKAAKNKK